jgi:hypothetical protein
MKVVVMDVPFYVRMKLPLQVKGQLREALGCPLIFQNDG